MYSRFSDVRQMVDARIYQGIHFRFADEDARTQGIQVADWAFEHYLRPLPVVALKDDGGTTTMIVMIIISLTSEPPHS